MPTLQLGESTDHEMPSFSAAASNRRLQRMSGESGHRKEAEPVQAFRAGVRAGRPNFRVIEQGSPLTIISVAGEAGVGVARPVREFLKRVFDILGAALLAVAFSPLILVIAVLLRREGGASYFAIAASGATAKLDCLKFRSMVPNA